MATEPDVSAGAPAELQITVALAEYIQTVSADEKQKAQPELARFSRWVGADRLVSALAPPEIGEYGDIVSARGTAPDAAERLAAVKAFLAYLKKQGHIEVGLAQHLRVRKARASTLSKNKEEARVIRLTKEGHADITQRLEEYRGQRQSLAEQIHRAAQDKDVRENAPLEAAREAQGLLMSKIAEAEATLRHSEIIEDDGSGSRKEMVMLGSNITLQDMAGGRPMAYQIVEPNEANPLNAKISNASPVGAAVLGKAVGDKITVNTPRGEQTYEIVKTR
ncbi:MAG: GreA/GreB family elongation factor [Chloroflexi bacterium]|nr:GreA/GreB family elongation factor [Chloroflexota bacterium]